MTWCTDTAKLQSMAIVFYQQLYTREARTGDGGVHWQLPTLNRNSGWWLNWVVTDHEIKLAIF